MEKLDFNSVLNNAREKYRTLKRGTDCPLDEVILDYVHNELTEKENKTTSEHMETCERCHMLAMKMEADLTAWEYSFDNDPDSALEDALGEAGLKRLENTGLVSGIKYRLVLAKLKELFANLFQGDWHPGELLLAPAYRGSEDEDTEGSVKRAKIIDIGEQALLLVVRLTPENGEEVGISLQIYPSGSILYLPAGLHVIVLDQSGDVFMEAEAESKNDLMELTWTRESGDQYSVRISLGDAAVTEKL